MLIFILQPLTVCQTVKALRRLKAKISFITFRYQKSACTAAILTKDLVIV